VPRPGGASGVLARILRAALGSVGLASTLLRFSGSLFEAVFAALLSVPSVQLNFHANPVELRSTALEGKVGAEALRDGGPIGWLLASLRADDVRGRHAWSALEDHGVAAGESPELYRDLYAAAAPIWVDDGYLDHYVVVPIDSDVLDAWYSLSFAQQQVYAAQELRRFEPVEPKGFSLRQGGADDVDAAMSLAFTIFDHQAEGPTWAGAPAPTEDEARGSYAEYLADPGVAYFLAERDGKALGHLALERETDSTVYLSIAATVPEARGFGVGRALTEAALAWADERGYNTCVTDWRSANLEAARFWPARGFRPTAYRLFRSITLTPRVPHPRSAQA
jgi:GNAT superfamily N-acetyltransferase